MSNADVIAIGLITLVSVAIGLWGTRVSRSTSDFLVASRTVTPFWNASAISGEYLSAASFLGIAGLVYLYGIDMLWYPIGYTVGYLVLLLFVAAPLRRSGAYTIPDFAEARLESLAVRRVSAALVVIIGWLYLLPQFQGAGLTLSILTGAPDWVGKLVVAVAVIVSVVAGGMRSITFVQAFQFWFKLTAIALPAITLLVVWYRDEGPAFATEGWQVPLSGFGGRDLAVYTTISLVVATFLGTMGLPHILVRFYTNPDGASARRTTLVVLMLLSAFYLFPPVIGALGRAYAPALAATGQAYVVVLVLPELVVPGPWGQLLTALVSAGAFAAFLSTASGLAVSVAGVLSQDVLGQFGRSARRAHSGVRRFRQGTVIAVVVPLILALAAGRLNIAETVAMAFAVAASTFCPLLLLGIWWPRLSVPGALAALIVGGTLAVTAVTSALLLGPFTSWWGTLLIEPAAWSVPIAFAVAIVVSLLTPDRIPPHTRRTLALLHTPEQLPEQGFTARNR
jgi:cation/acetate symporter